MVGSLVRVSRRVGWRPTYSRHCWELHCTANAQTPHAQPLLHITKTTKNDRTATRGAHRQATNTTLLLENLHRSVHSVTVQPPGYNTSRPKATGHLPGDQYYNRSSHPIGRGFGTNTTKCTAIVDTRANVRNPDRAHATPTLPPIMAELCVRHTSWFHPFAC